MAHLGWATQVEAGRAHIFDAAPGTPQEKKGENSCGTEPEHIHWRMLQLATNITAIPMAQTHGSLTPVALQVDHERPNCSARASWLESAQAPLAKGHWSPFDATPTHGAGPRVNALVPSATFLMKAVFSGSTGFRVSSHKPVKQRHITSFTPG